VRRLLALFGVLAASPAFAAVPDAQLCEFGDLLPVARAEIIGSGNAFFEHEASYCSTSPRECARRSYVVPGDLVVTGTSRDGYICASFFAKTKLVSGWIEASRLRRHDDPAPNLQDWTGEWTNGWWGRIRLSRLGDRVKVSGFAQWQQFDINARPIRGGITTGGVEGTARPQGTLLYISEGDDSCTVTMRLLVGKLFVRDNRSCGGLNVTFTGVYERAGHRVR
jgi:hypothetical protein